MCDPQTSVIDVLLLDPLTFGFKLAENSTGRAKLSSRKESMNQVQSPLSKGSVLAHDMASVEVLVRNNTKEMIRMSLSITCRDVAGENCIEGKKATVLCSGELNIEDAIQAALQTSVMDVLLLDPLTFGFKLAENSTGRAKLMDSAESLPLMEGEGRSFRVKGFNQNQRAAFVQIMMRYGTLFLTHIAEDITDSPTFSDGVPKEGRRIEDVKAASEKPGTPLFPDDIASRFPGLKSGRFWKEHQDLLLLRSVLKHGYGRWQAIVDDKDLKVQEVICHELNLPVVTLPMPGASQSQDGANVVSTETPMNETKATVVGNDLAVDAANRAPDAANRSQLFQDSSSLYHYREMQRKQVEFIKKKGDTKANETPIEEPETEAKVLDIPSPCSMDIDSQTSNQLPQVINGVPKGLRIEDVLGRIAVSLLIRDKVKAASEKPGTPLFPDDIVSRFPGLKSGRFWKEHHDLLLLRSVLKHGYGRWHAIVDDKDLKVQEVICQELNLPVVTLPVPGASQSQDGANVVSAETPMNETKATVVGNDLAVDAANRAPDAANRSQLFQDSSSLYHYREMQRRQVEFIKKKGDTKANETPIEEPETEAKVLDIPSPCSMDIDSQTSNQLPQVINGVPKGLRIEDVLGRIAVSLLIRDKFKDQLANYGTGVLH
ncbi:hypothetical protein TEA_000033 [Camellia sinensis var. sinensis]|uniref:CHD subfamily II SANT-like domain-containing protein n=1 Tax=Camellia sinensis var. sinensis TaxID=542762 RepID=A0A4S4ESG6_CAMSN|nr:hypothetical protein TEA_000033 [Camellia sinensis var. sinensis]